jgi:hypothetical protein
MQAQFQTFFGCHPSWRAIREKMRRWSGIPLGRSGSGHCGPPPGHPPPHGLAIEPSAARQRPGADFPSAGVPLGSRIQIGGPWPVVILYHVPDSLSSSRSCFSHGARAHAWPGPGTLAGHFVNFIFHSRTLPELYGTFLAHKKTTPIAGASPAAKECHRQNAISVLKSGR